MRVILKGKQKKTVKRKAEKLKNWKRRKLKFITKGGKGKLEKKITLGELYEGERTEISGWNKKTDRKR